MKKIIVIFMAFALIFSIGCKEELVMDTVAVGEPVVVDFTPKTARLGDEVVITGEYLSSIYKVYFNSDSTAEGTISQLVSDEKMIIKVSKTSLSGTITVQNTSGKGNSADALTVNFPVPTIGTFVDSAETFSYIEITGSDMDAVNEVLFDTIPGEIVETWRDVLVVKVPFYWNEIVNISLTYNDEAVVDTVTSTDDFLLVRVQPIFTDVPLFLNVEKTISITGEKLKVIESVFLNDKEVNILTNQDTLIQFNIPEGDFESSTGDVEFSYVFNAGYQVDTLDEVVRVVVPLIDVFEDYKLFPRGKAADNFADFLTGGTYDMCASWEDVLRDNISLLAYASPGGYIQFRSPHNAGTVIKNYKCDGSDATALPADNGTRYCQMERLQATDESNGAIHAKYIDLIQSGEINMYLDDTVFIEDLNNDVTTISPTGANLSYYNDDNLNADGSQPQIEIGDVIAIKHIAYVDDIPYYHYGFIHFTDGFADESGIIGNKVDLETDGSYLKFDVYLVKELNGF